jgi:hypothetical protein
MSVNPTGCCPKFNPEGWDAQELHFSDKPFVKARSRSVLHVPLNMGSVFSRVLKHVEQAGALGADDFIVLSRDLSPWASEHLFAVAKSVPNEEMTTLTGDFVTKVFEGPYRQARRWHREMRRLGRDRNAAPAEIWFFYTTCPKCARAYGKNYVVGVAALAAARSAPALEEH